MTPAVTPEVQSAITDAFQQEWARVVATVIRLTGDWDLAEEGLPHRTASVDSDLGQGSDHRRP